VIVKQKLNFPKDVQEKLDDPGKSNQEKANILIDDLAKKVNKKAPVPKDVNKSNPHLNHHRNRDQTASA
jgi:hypothetical protein